ncbi:MAG: hypothetical protein R6W76_20110 [Caldilinea sp.]
MSNILQKSLVCLLMLSLLAVPSGSVVLAQGQGNITLPYEETGEFTNAAYEIRVPEGWNGVLLVYAHGYAFDAPPPAAAPGEPPINDALEDFFLNHGYALAGSSYRNGGWAVKEGIQNTLALTNRFSGLIGKPNQTILWGFSMGSLISLDLLDHHAATFDGAIAACGPLAGAPVNWDTALALALAYDVAFGWPANWGAVGDVRDDIDFWSEVFPVLSAQLQDLNSFAKFEFMRRVTDLPFEEFYPDLTNGKMGWLLLDMLFTTQFRGELEARAGGPVAQNRDHMYWLSSADKAELDAYLGEGFSDDLLAAMSDRTNITAKKSARNYVEKYSIPSGALRRPVITLHNTIDGLAQPWNEGVFAQRVASAGKSDLLLQTYVDAVGHCNFTAEQLFVAVSAMHSWLAAGTRPDADAWFPQDLGFNNDFTPQSAPFLPLLAGASSVRESAMSDNQVFLPTIQR